MGWGMMKRDAVGRLKREAPYGLYIPLDFVSTA